MEERRDESQCGMFRGEPTSWLVTIGVMGVYALLFFGGNAVRCGVDGHWMMAGLLLMGAMVGMGMAIGVVEEMQRRRRAKRRQMETHREKRVKRESRERRSGSAA